MHPALPAESFRPLATVVPDLGTRPSCWHSPASKSVCLGIFTCIPLAEGWAQSAILVLGAGDPGGNRPRAQSAIPVVGSAASAAATIKIRRRQAPSYQVHSHVAEAVH